MHPIQNISKLYSPVQPSVLAENGSGVSYLEYFPHPVIRPFVYRYWQLKTIQKLDYDFTYRVVADGCIDILFCLDEPGKSYVAGFAGKYDDVSLGNEFSYIGMRFFPAMFTQLFSLPAHELGSGYTDLALAIPGYANYIRRYITPVSSLPFIFDVLDNYLQDTIRNSKMKYDGRLYEAVCQIISSKGNIKMNALGNTGVSPRQLSRLFLHYIGDTPKAFSKVVRFQGILNLQPTALSLRTSKPYYDLGYTDQSHFIKEFKALYGDTPSFAL